ncbi:hypothetical protein ASPVEDRAFT_301682 [Aspergillus versicolor CBS 583.65]|uniref:Uncharacterized protein n=1 Tax=Aspergillus versicolor CBS 583.65 TaxID=1036611 RepID=A0A1L9P868_ASPVE|nr:uncharacterized protein ASPVEDRAFT_301682 [Aspergillus versicolor CBS 583.65]OJI97624.1 hypothetical protein ASPVEDRAFT_301682 [Aspergillus versicolor CBS 583.65]
MFYAPYCSDSILEYNSLTQVTWTNRSSQHIKPHAVRSHPSFFSSSPSRKSWPCATINTQRSKHPILPTIQKIKISNDATMVKGQTAILNQTLHRRRNSHQHAKHRDNQHMHPKSPHRSVRILRAAQSRPTKSTYPRIPRCRHTLLKRHKVEVARPTALSTLERMCTTRNTT